MKLFTSEIEQFYHSTQSSSENQIEKDELIQYVIECSEYLERECTKYHHECNKKYKPIWDDELVNPIKWNVFQYGSSSRNTSCKDSDIDIAISTYSDLSRAHKKYLLYHLALIIGKNDIDGSLIIKTLLNASYPIIRITQSKLNMQIDVSIADRFCEPTNDFLSNILTYFEALSLIPIKPLIVFIKHWSKQRGINNAYRRYLNSYGYTLLVISFLQNNDCTDLKLAYLVYKFFEFYAIYFDERIHAVSVSLIGCENDQKKQQFAEKKGKDAMEIMDPINCKNNVAHRVGLAQCQRIKQEFVSSYRLIKQYRDKTITDRQSIFNLLLRKSSDFMIDEDKENIHLDQNLYVYDYKAADCELSSRKYKNVYDGKYFQNNCKIYNLYQQNPFKNGFIKVSKSESYEGVYENPFRDRSINK